MLNLKAKNQFIMKPMVCLLLIMGCMYCPDAYPTANGDDRYLDRELASPGGHQLASWIVSQLRKADYVEEEAPAIAIPYRLPIGSKRNSELTSSIMTLPRTMIDNGRK